jgi:hypothetical protein
LSPAHHARRMATGTLTELIETTAAQRPDAAALPGLT